MKDNQRSLLTLKPEKGARDQGAWAEGGRKPACPLAPRGRQPCPPSMSAPWDPLRVLTQNCKKLMQDSERVDECPGPPPNSVGDKDRTTQRLCSRGWIIR